MSSSRGDALAKIDSLMALSSAPTTALVGVIEYLMSGTLSLHQHH
jgi:hypothetical protein